MKQPNYDLNPHDTPHYYDLEQGRLIVGEQAYQRAYDSSPQRPNHIQALGDILLDNSLVVEPTRHAKVDASRWTAPTYLKFGRWLDLAVTPLDSQTTNVSQDVIDRSYRFGLGPTSVRITQEHNFGSLITFYDEAGINYHCAPGRYSNWSRDKFVDHVERAFLALQPGQSVTAVLAAIALAKEGPGLKIIRTHAGNILSLLAERGYPDIPRWSDDDFLDWGVAYMLANNGIVPTKSKLDYLSTLKRGPSGRTIFNHFDSLLDYQDQINSRHGETSKTLDTKLQEHKALLRSRRRGSLLILPAMNSNYIPPWLALRLSAQYIVLDELGFGLTEDKKERLASTMRQRDFVSGIRRALPPHAQLHIAKVAKDIGVEEDIWPAHNPEYLQLPQKLKAA